VLSKDIHHSDIFVPTQFTCAVRSPHCSLYVVCVLWSAREVKKNLYIRTDMKRGPH